MTIEDIIKPILKVREGFSLKVYKDSMGYDTIYYGHKVVPGEVYLFTQADADAYLEKDISLAEMQAGSIFPEFKSFSLSRQAALVMLIFNMGADKIKRDFPRFVHDVNTNQWDEAANELKYSDGKSILSNWYKQVGHDRADEIINMLIQE
jgi:GH24 family phage-related lysozyme (muramidase)